MTTTTHLGIQIDPTRDSLISEEGRDMLRKFYLLPHEDSIQKAYARAANCFSFGNHALAQRIYDYVSLKWFMYASPVLSNAIEIDWSTVPQNYWAPYKSKDLAEWVEINIKQRARGLPISCFLTFVPDHLRGLIDHTEEERWMSVLGGGVGGHWSSVRSVSDKAPGPIPFLKTIDADMTAYMQGRTRKGSYAAYLSVDHPDIREFIQMRKPSGGDPNRKCLNLHNGVNITDAFLDAVRTDSFYNLIDPNDKTVRESVRAREIWELILDTRQKTGEPYLFYIDAANRQLPEHLKNLGLKINGSNLCTEITLPTSEDRSAVCCLSSVNAEFFDSWKDSTMIEDLVEFLDNVLEFFILAAPPTLRKAVNSASNERSIGIGLMGFHSYLQSKNVPFEGVAAMSINRHLFSNLKKKADAASQALATIRGACPDSEAGNSAIPIRNSHLIAPAPNASSSISAGCSPATEPWSSNAMVRKTRSGDAFVLNEYLRRLIIKHAELNNLDQLWIDEQIRSVVSHEGSVLHLDWMTDFQKDVFKTAFEIDQMWTIEHARIRQPFIDQAQSVNLFFGAVVTKKYVNRCHLAAFAPPDERGGVPLKSLYYFRTKPLKKGENLSEIIERVALKEAQEDNNSSNVDECLSCHG